MFFPEEDDDESLLHPTGPPVLGTAKGQFVVPDDFDQPLEEFAEYM